MGIRLPTIIHHAKHIFSPRAVHNHASASKRADVPKGHLAVYVGESYKHRFVVPISYLKHPLFQDLLRRAEEEHGYDHPMGGLTIPCSKNTFLYITSHLNECR
jgi:SAUR family protein